MSVAELIAALAAFPPDALVITNGYEAGFQAASPPIALDVAGPDQDAPAFFGDYIEPDQAGGGGYAANLPLVHAVLISRYDRDQYETAPVSGPS